MERDKLQIYVDADACPVKREIIRTAERHGLQVYMVCNQWLDVPESPLVRLQVVPEGFDAADDWIVENIGNRDIVITADIPLAARCLDVGAKVLGPTGKPFTEDNIGAAVAMRELNTDLRAMGELRGGNATFSKADRSRFLDALDQLIQKVVRG